MYDYNAAQWRSFYFADSLRPLTPRDDPRCEDDEELPGHCIHRFEITRPACRVCSGTPCEACPDFETEEEPE